MTAPPPWVVALSLILGLILGLGLGLTATSAAAVETATVERTPQGALLIHWTGSNPVDVYVSTKADAPLNAATLLVKGDVAGVYEAEPPPAGRPYFILKDEVDGTTTRVAERLLPLQRGSNFRDLGGYPAADGKHIRWGLIYRAAAEPLLTAADYDYLGHLGIRFDVDLRSVEERQIASDQLPAKLSLQYFAIDYPARDIFGAPGLGSGGNSTKTVIVGLYRQWPTSLAPQFRTIFRDLLAHQGAVTYHCSAGQDRTGIATAVLLTALGVPRQIILADYNLSTADRRPDNEIPPIAPDAYPGNIVADYYRRIQSSRVTSKPSPLVDAAGQPYLSATFDEIERRWGTVDNYLDKVLGVTPADIEELRKIYLE